MSMVSLVPALVAAVSLVLLYFGGDWLIRGASALASRWGVSPLAIGLTVVAFGTSVPELVVSLKAAVNGADAVAVANVVGSNIVNIALILGVSALIRAAQVHARLLWVDMPLMVGCSVLLVWMLSDGKCSRVEGAVLLGGLVAYTWFTFWESNRETDAVKQEFASAAPTENLSVVRSSIRIVCGLGLLFAGGHLFVDSAVKLANQLEVSQAVIGLTIVALGTSLPEFVTSVLAARRGQGEIAIGNIVGSNLFNILGILGFTALVRPLDGSSMTRVDLSAMVGLALLLSLFMFTRRTLDRIEGAALLAIYFAYTAWLVWT